MVAWPNGSWHLQLHDSVPIASSKQTSKCLVFRCYRLCIPSTDEPSLPPQMSGRWGENSGWEIGLVSRKVRLLQSSRNSRDFRDRDGVCLAIVRLEICGNYSPILIASYAATALSSEKLVDSLCMRVNIVILMTCTMSCSVCGHVRLGAEAISQPHRRAR